ncbi:hypothetical protein V3O24_12815 [Methylobacter sp. Wu8]|uniref:hypothetical protein n=1 Tax=Methylobacter sp. Wu8 TaxID=3118457 RepID=UPI002F2FCA29
MEEFDYVGLRDGEKMDSMEYSILNDRLKLESMDYWRLCDELTIVQAALLVVGEDPSTGNAYVENWDLHNRPTGYEAAKTAISNGLKKSAISGNLIPHYDLDINGNVCGEIPGTIDVALSTVDVESLRNWLSNRGFLRGFFFPIVRDNPDYLSLDHPRYAPKLAAAVRAWQAMEDENLRRGKSVKSAMEQWLTSNYKSLGLVHKRSSDKHGYNAGDMNKSAITEAAKIANWEEDGGAPKTLCD